MAKTKKPTKGPNALHKMAATVPTPPPPKKENKSSKNKSSNKTK